MLTSGLCAHVTCLIRTYLACRWPRTKGKETRRLEVKAHPLKPYSTSWLTPSSDPMSRDSDRQTLSQYNMGHCSWFAGRTYSKSIWFGRRGSSVKKDCALLSTYGEGCVGAG